MPENNGRSDVAAWLTEEWTARLASSIEMMTEIRPELMRGAPIAASSVETAGVLWHSIVLDLAPGAAVLIGATGETWSQIGKSALLAAGVDESDASDVRGTYLEIIGQAASGLAQAISARLGAQVAVLPVKEARLGDTGVTTLAPIELLLRDHPPQRIYIGFNAALELAVAPSQTSALVVKDTEGTPRTLDLLLEVELPVSVSFGRAELPLRDVLKLISGSIVELNRTISDPVEIIVNNCVIARGEVVVVEGNYGVRIQQVVSREERLRTLK